MWNAHSSSNSNKWNEPQSLNMNGRVNEMASEWMKDQSGKNKEMRSRNQLFYIPLFLYYNFNVCWLSNSHSLNLFGQFFSFRSVVFFFFSPLIFFGPVLHAKLNTLKMKSWWYSLVHHLDSISKIIEIFTGNTKSSIIIIAPASPLRLPLSSSLWSSLIRFHSHQIFCLFRPSIFFFFFFFCCSSLDSFTSFSHFSLSLSHSHVEFGVHLC